MRGSDQALTALVDDYSGPDQHHHVVAFWLSLMSLGTFIACSTSSPDFKIPASATPVSPTPLPTSQTPAPSPTPTETRIPASATPTNTLVVKSPTPTLSLTPVPAYVFPIQPPE